MATWIAHLRIAENLLNIGETGGLEGLDPRQFAIGNVGPDSGIPDEKWEKFNPSTEITHFRTGKEARYPIADLKFYHRYLADRSKVSDPRRSSFLLGYFTHLVTDNLWHERISAPGMKLFADRVAKDRSFVWEVKRDWYGLDFLYVRSHPDCLFWQVFLDCEYTEEYLDYLPKEAICRNLAHIKTFYQRTDDEIEKWYIQMPGIYLTAQVMDSFVEESTQVLSGILRQVIEGKTVDSTKNSFLE